MVEAPETGHASSTSHERANIRAMATLPLTVVPPRLIDDDDGRIDG